MKCFADMLLKEFADLNLIICDINNITIPIKGIKYITKKITSQNLIRIFDYLHKGDILVDLSMNIDCLELWPYA